MGRAAPRRSKASSVVAIVVACAAVACGTLLSINNDDTLAGDASAPDAGPDASPPGDATGSEAGGDAAGSDDGASGDASDCRTKAAGTKCGDPDAGNVCLADGGCQACIGNGVGACVASGECCDGHCSAFPDASIGSCTGVTGCTVLNEFCQNTPCCLPYTCNAGTNRCQ